MVGNPVRPGRPVRCLSFHSDYGCANTGVCCSSGWTIAVETPVELALKPALAAASARLPHGPDGFLIANEPPPGCSSTLRVSDLTGACWFRDTNAGLCSVHRELGEPALPSACRQFPRVCVLEPDMVTLSLTHYCPTAAGLLFRPEPEFRLTDHPKSFPKDWPYEGLDARNSYSPFLRPAVLLGFDGLRALEDVAVGVFAQADVFAAVSRFRWFIETIRTWTPAEGDLPGLIRGTVATGRVPFATSDPRIVLMNSLTVGAQVVETLPKWNGRVGPVDGPIDLALRRYLAARLVGSWITFMADDLRTTAAYLELCLNTVFLFEGARERTEPDSPRWKEAIRSADLWLMHHCDPELITKNCGSVAA